MKVPHAEYVKKMLKRFNLADAKHVSVPLGGHFKLSEAQTPMTEDEKALISKVPHASAVGSLMYAMVYMKPNIDQAVRVVNMYSTILERNIGEL